MATDRTWGARAEIYFTPRMVTTDMLAQREAAIAGVGVVQLPLLMVRDQLAAGELEVILDAWQPQLGSDSRGLRLSPRYAAIGASTGRFSGVKNISEWKRIDFCRRGVGETVLSTPGRLLHPPDLRNIRKARDRVRALLKYALSGPQCCECLDGLFIMLTIIRIYKIYTDWLV